MTTAALGIGGLAVVVAATVVALVARVSGRYLRPAALATVGLMLLQIVLAERGVLRQWDRVPPPFMPTVLSAVVVVCVVTLSRLGRRLADGLPFASLIGFQVFRLPLEIVMHRAATVGLMPIQMSYSGRNFDIATGILALPVALLAARARAPRWLLWGWNAIGTCLLANIVAIAVISLPVFAAFGPDRVNTFVADPPFIWLPGVLVPAALFGHVLTWRKLARST